MYSAIEMLQQAYANEVMSWVRCFEWDMCVKRAGTWPVWIFCFY